MTKIVKSNHSTRVVNNKINTSGMNTSSFCYHKTPVETPNGVITVFTLPDSQQYVSGLLEVFLDGLLQIKDTDYTETSSTTFTMTTAPATGEVVRLNYIKQ